MKSSNIAVTMIENTEFVNNYGDKGASISFEKGGGLFCINCVFRLDETKSSNEMYADLWEAEAKMENLFTEIIDDDDITI